MFRVLIAPLFVYTLGWGLNGAWYTIALDQTTRAAVVYARFHTDRWMHMRGAGLSGKPAAEKGD